MSVASANEAARSKAITAIDVPPWRLSGVVYGALLNHAPQLAALGAAAHEPPYKAPPRAPVLEVKPRHMLATDGAVVRVPGGVDALVITASLGIVIGAAACRVNVTRAREHIAGYVVLGDISVPVPNHYRPGARYKARDGFCPLGSRVVAAASVRDPDALGGRVRVDGAVAHTFTTGERVRDVAHLLADVSEFMALQAGDVLALGVAHGAPLVAPGHDVLLEIDGVGSLAIRVEADAS
jgi:5-oxopent-3-ene-1,2,5-tricarboxylate decarboxylase / 2-hydroxyhepta-2,4-diene-1,7-dioate isomerase